MTLAEVMDWLETFELFDYYYIGKINGAKPRVLGIYTNASGGKPPHALGQPSSYVINSVKLLVHGTKNENETQILANALFTALTDVASVETGENYIHFVDLQVPEPLHIGTDTNGFYEFVINLDIYSRR